MRAVGWIALLGACGRVDFDPAVVGASDAVIVPPPLDSAFAGCAGNAGTTTPIRIGAGASPFCIDGTEVTAAQYAAFLVTSPSLADQPAVCAFNTDYTPSAIQGRWPIAVGAENLPIGAVDWCDARAYCAWAGKRLCGKIGGGALDGPSRGDPVQSEWTFACTMGGAMGMFGYPYGPSYQAGRCVDSVYPGALGGSTPVDVGSATNCEGGFPGLFDMAGNITEWEDSCETVTGPTDGCAYRGGEYGHAMDATSCDVQEVFQRSDVTQGTGGFRCCSDAL